MILPALANFNQASIPGSIQDISIGGLMMEIDGHSVIVAEAEHLIADRAPVVVDVPRLALHGIPATVVRAEQNTRGFNVALHFDQPRVDIAQKIIKRFA